MTRRNPTSQSLRLMMSMTTMRRKPMTRVKLQPKDGGKDECCLQLRWGGVCVCTRIIQLHFNIVIFFTFFFSLLSCYNGSRSLLGPSPAGGCLLKVVSSI